MFEAHPLRLLPLTDTFCEILGERIRESDKQDCIAHGLSEAEALKEGSYGGPSAAVFQEGSLIGALGWTYAGSIWSLWADLSRDQSRAVMEVTPRVVLDMALHARRPLSNVVWEGNRGTIAWLRASHCFTFLDSRFEYAGKSFLPFFVKPLEELRACVTR